MRRVDPDDGEWVSLEQPDGSNRRVWRPDEQPPAPDGTFGSWYVVTEDGADRMEWVSAWRWAEAVDAPAIVAPTAESAPVERPLLTRRFVLGWATAAALTAVVVVGLDALRGGSGQARPATAAELAKDVEIVFDRFAIEDDVFDGRSGGLAVTFVNQGKTARTFWTTVTASGTGGVLATETIYVQGLEPGRSTTQQAFASVPNLDGLAAATFTVTRTDGAPPPLMITEP